MSARKKRIEELAIDNLPRFVASQVKSSNLDLELIVQALVLLTSKGKEVAAVASIPDEYRILSSKVLVDLSSYISSVLNLGFYSFIAQGYIVDAINKAAREGIKKYGVKVDGNNIYLHSLGSHIVSISLSSKPSHLQVSCGGSVSSIKEEKDKIEQLNALIEAIKTFSEGKPVIFSDASSSRTFSSLFKPLSVIKEFGRSRNPRTGNYMQFGILIPENPITSDNKSGRPSEMAIRSGFLGLCGGCYIAAQYGVSSIEDAKKALSNIQEKMIADKKGISIISFWQDCDTELLEEYGIKLVPHTTNLYYYELYK